MKIILSHPTGNANVREVADALARAGLLEKFYTCIAFFQNTFSNILSEYGPFKEFRRRTLNSNLKPFTCTRPFKELGRLASQKLGYQYALAHEKGIFCIDRVYQDLDSHVSKNLGEVNAVYAYEDGALHTFRRARSRGIVCLYDLPIGYWRAHKKYLELEKLKRPDWAMTLTGLKDSEKKLSYKDQELALADIIFVASNFTKKTLELYPGTLAPIHVIPYGFPEVYQNRSYDRFVNRKLRLLFVGSLSQRKGLANLLDAAEHLSDLVELTIIGRRVEESCEVLDRELATHTWMESLSNSEILNLMRTHDIFVFPSLFEGYGLVISEAMSQGTPVITTERTCGADFIRDGKNGWLVNAGDSKSLIQKLETILEQPECLEKVGQEAMRTAEAMPRTLYGKRIAKIITQYLENNSL
ncbi:MAG TPA: glycosyltransferase family 4 protein [Gillisia sp.]|nr:glycosyltransferase family 4 protein [Gillisia sp.]